MAITYHDPRGESRVAPQPYTPRAPADGPVTVGLLANGFPDSEAFLDAVERALERELAGATFRRYRKPGASIPANDALVSAIAAECDALVTAYGH